MSLSADYAVFFNIVQNVFDPPPPFALNIWYFFLTDWEALCTALTLNIPYNPNNSTLKKSFCVNFKWILCHYEICFWSATMTCKKIDLPRWFAKNLSAKMICKKIDLPQLFAKIWSATVICKNVISHDDLQNIWFATMICKNFICHDDFQKFDLPR